MQLTGYLDTVSRSILRGWVANKQSPDESLRVSIHVNGMLIAQLRAEDFREDLVEVFPGATGHYAFSYHFSPPLSSFDDQEGSIMVGHNLLPSRNWVRRLATITQATTPLLVTSAGRCGSTLMMNLLNAHPEIVLHAQHPAEVKQLSYYALALRTLTTSADHERSTNPDAMLADSYSVGFNPFNDPAYSKHPLVESYWSRIAPMALASAFRDIIMSHYEAIRFISGKDKMVYFAEKAQPVPVVRQSAKMMFGTVREIALIRDPRDLVCSYHAFWNTDYDDARRTVLSQLSPL